MSGKASGSKKRSMSDEAVAAKTGRTWGEWFKLLDAAGARKMPHREIARLLHSKHRVPGWWSQMVTVEYERARGMRKVHQTTAGFVAGVSRTFDASVGALFHAWTDARLQRRWLGAAKLTITTAARNKTVRMAWADGTRSEAHFAPRGTARCQVAVQHSKLRGPRAVAEMKKFWSAAFDRLAKVVGA
jgi:uncharacterized protein YndB with AHSA1/START domain